MQLIKRRDLLLEHLIKKETVEDLFKSAGYAVTCSAIFRFTSMASKQQETLSVIMLLITFFILITVSIIYFAKHVAMPMGEAINPQYIDWKNRYKKYTGIKKYIELFKQKLLIEKHGFYLLITTWYFGFGNVIGEVLVNAVLKA
ncbi:hypothetical protein [Colwellia sp. 20A7]|uniref:hypothetical protein n=1 Tax=Colwellia sp. 20A7 TaxID=2689569 RepID=UPI0019167861|nr:hypothetical protein [Colwellia sp. 20A7]